VPVTRIGAMMVGEGLAVHAQGIPIAQPVRLGFEH
jgi:hypothetical protein